MFTSFFWRKVALDYARTFVPVFILGLAPVWDSVVAGDWTAARSATVAAIAAAGSAALRAVQALFTNLETPPEE